MFWRNTAIIIILITILIVLMVTGIESDVEQQPDVLGGIELAAPSPRRLIVDEQIVSLNEALDLIEILFVALFFGVIHVFGPRFRAFMKATGKDVILGSLGGGIAIAYIFLQLLPELEAAEQRLLGDSIHLIVLVGFVVFWGLEVKLQAGQNIVHVRQWSMTASTFVFHVALGGMYNWLLIYAMPTQLHAGGPQALIGAIPLGLHLVYKDFLMGEHQPKEFDKWGRYILAAAPLIGWTAVLLATPSEVFSDLLIAVLTGYIIHTVFRSELPAFEESSFRWFLSGVVIYTFLLRVSSVLLTSPGA
ncbi:MAG: hypothetical protein IIB17_04760 [Chloroflexi bacterium]|nr:hypothetical protein [Chloroflexota bacterium]